MSNKDLVIEYVSVDDLIAYKNNSRTHDDDQVDQIAKSIRQFGFTNPLLIDENKGIIAGHGRLMAAMQNDMVQVPTITLAGLSDEQKRAYVIADNKLALNAGWDYQLLKIEIEALELADFNIELLGFDVQELEAICLPPDFNEDESTDDDEGKEKKGKVHTCPSCGDEFED